MVDSQSDESGPHLLIFRPLIQRDQYKHVSSNCVPAIIAEEGMWYSWVHAKLSYPSQMGLQFFPRG